MIQKKLLVAIVSILLMGMLPLHGYAVIETSFDPNFDYLESGQASISNQGNGTISISGQTNATQYVSTIGIKLIVQRWDGSTWLNYNTGQNLTLQNESYIYISDQLNVSTGYYYRIRSIHWTIEGGVSEQGERFTSSILIN